MFRYTAAGVIRRNVAASPRLSQTVVRQQTRKGSGGNAPIIAHNVNESMGWGFYVTFAALPILTMLYQYSRPGPNGEMHWITRQVFDYQVEMKDVWRDRNVARTQAIEQAAHDKHLFMYANMGEAPYFEVRYPDAIFAGCVRNVPAGHLANMDYVVEHYRQKHIDSEAQKAQKLAAKEAAVASKS